MTIADEKFFAWLDGELPPEEARQVEAQVAGDPELKRLAEQHRSMQHGLKTAFDTVAEAPVPDALVSAMHAPGAQLIDFAARKRAREQSHWGSPGQWAALAASLVIGVFLGTAIPHQANSPVELESGKIYASSSLGTALDRELASAPGGPIRIGMTFRNRSGAVCRTFIDREASGLACKDKARWKLQGLFAAPEGQGSAYRMAGGMNPGLAALVDSNISGEPFDASQEVEAKRHGWR